MRHKKLPKGAKVPKVQGKIDYWVAVQDVQEDDLNADIYNYKALDEIALSIEKVGLEVPPTVWKDSVSLMSGHTRFRAFLKNGYTHLPVIEHPEYRPESEFERVKRLHVLNMYRDLLFPDRYRGVKIARDAYLKETGKVMSADQMTELLADWRVKAGDWNAMETLRQKYQVFYNNVLLGEMGIREAYKAATVKKPKMRMRRDLSSLLNKNDVRYLITSICQTVDGLKNLDTGIISLGNTFKPLTKVDANFYSTAAHASACAYMAHKLNSFDGFADDWQVTDNQNVWHDVYSQEDDTGIEIKTSQGKMGETPRWTPKRFKEGYHLLIQIAPPNHLGEIESAFVGFGKLTEKDVKPINGGKVEVVPDRLWQLYQNGDFEVWWGKLSTDKNGTLSFKQQLVMQ